MTIASGRPAVAIVTTHWGADRSESADVVRLLAGALATAARVEIVHLDGAAEALLDERDSVFHVHHVPLQGARPLAGAVLRSAYSAVGVAVPPASVQPAIRALEGHPVGLAELLGTIRPRVIVLAGLPLPLEPEVLAAGAPRIVAWPLLSDLSMIAEEPVRAQLLLADSLGSLHPGEHHALLAHDPLLAARAVPLDIALALNRSSAEHGLFGVAWFGRYVLAIRHFPVTAPRFERSVTRELLRSVLGDIAIAEVDGTSWRVTDVENTALLPVNPSRVNLWRLMAHAEFTVDLRPASPFGREAIESMLFSSPPIVAEDSAARFHAEAANGGLWYRNHGELLDLSRTLLDDGALRQGLRASGLAYAVQHHERMDDFVARTVAQVLG